MSDFQPCRYRQELIQFSREGGKATVQRCTQAAAPQFGLTVLPADCTDCPLRAGPPPAPKVPARAPRKTLSAEDRKSKPDTMDTPLWPFCGDRFTLLIPTCCGKCRTIRRCKCPEASTFGRQVLSADCRRCPVRKIKGPS